MSIRRTVSPPRLRDYLKFERKYPHLKNNLYYNTQIYNSFSFFLALTLLCFLAGFLRPFFWGICFGNFVLLGFLYVKTQRFCQGITVVRKLPRFSRERQMIEILYTISNETSFPLSDFSFTEEFDGVGVGHYVVKLDRSVPAHTRINIVKEVLLDSGMGVKTLSPLSFHLEDELGIFDFKLQFYQSEEIEVYPKIEKTPKLMASISPDTIEYGFYEVAKRGDSNLFIGTREYRHGDPVKHINWKLTKKTQKVVVNEYEKNTNTFITLLLDLDLGNQLGFGELSTWETAKDLALSITTNEMRKNNLIQVISNNLFIPFSSGRSQLDTIERHFTFHEMVKTNESHHLRHLHDLPARGQIYYICPMITTSKVTETLDYLVKLKMMGQDVMIFVLDPYHELTRNIKGEIKIGIMEMGRQAKAEFEGREKKLKLMGIPLVMIQVTQGVKLGDQLIQKARALIEVE